MCTYRESSVRIDKFTTANVERFLRGGVPTGKLYTSLRDGTGLVLLLRSTSIASWRFLYRKRGLGRAGHQRTVTLGRWPAVSCAAAIAEARRLGGEVASGKDPRAVIKAARLKLRTILSASIDDYEQWLTSRRITRVSETISSLRRGLAHLLHRDINDVERRAWIDAIERLQRNGLPGAAGALRRRMNAFFNRQLSLGTIPANPLAGYSAAASSKADAVEAEEHGMALNADQIFAVWGAAEAIGGPFGGLVRMGLLTGLRRNELASMRWDWIDRESLRITVPALNMKSGREHSVPITALIAKLLDETPNRGGGLVFPTGYRHGGATPLSGWTAHVARLRRESGVEKVSLHDLRRTFRTILADLGVPTDTAEIMVAHRRAGLVARYDRSQLWPQRCSAAETYDAWLAGIVARTDGPEAGNVVPLAGVTRAMR